MQLKKNTFSHSFSGKFSEKRNFKLVRSGSGFTMIELLISIFILAMGIASVLYVFPLGAQIQRSNQMASVSLQLSQQKMEEIISRSYAEIPVGTFEEDYGFDSNFSLYKRKTAVSYFDPENPQVPSSSDLGIKKIEITVAWKSFLGAGEKETVLATLIAKK